MIHARATVAIALLATMATGLSAQTVVRVRSQGAALLGAEVAAWDSLGQIAGARTDGLGLARLRVTRRVAPGAFLIARRLGFAPVRVPFVPADTIDVELIAVPVSLPVLATNIKPLRCSGREDAEAIALWRTLQARYKRGATKLYIAWTGGSALETIRAERRGYPSDDNEELTPRRRLDGTRVSGFGPDAMAMEHSDSPHYIGGPPLFINPPPYAEYERHINIAGEYWQWRYSALQERSAEHFLSDIFLVRHTLVMLGETLGASVIGFCPRDRHKAEIEGELQIGSDSLLRSARWAFRVPHDDEDAGGEATFDVAQFEGDTYLIAVRGSWWRGAGKGFYNQRRYEYTQWRLGRTYGESRINP